MTSTVRLFLQRWILFWIKEHVQPQIQNYNQKLVDNTSTLVLDQMFSFVLLFAQM